MKGKSSEWVKQHDSGKKNIWGRKNKCLGMGNLQYMFKRWMEQSEVACLEEEWEIRWLVEGKRENWFMSGHKGEVSEARLSTISF